MWTIRHFFDGEYGCEEKSVRKCVVTLQDEENHTVSLTVDDDWVTQQGLAEGDAFPYELFDICDEDGKPTGSIVERSYAHKYGIRHRTAHIWVVRTENGRKQVLLQKRAMNKDSFPGRFDTSSSGHIQAGDEPLDSAGRELYEELGIAAGAEDLKYAGYFDVRYEKEFHGKLFKDNEFAYVYCYDKPVDIAELVLQKEELDCVEWFDLEAVTAACAVHDPKFCVPGGGLAVITRYLRKRNED